MSPGSFDRACTGDLQIPLADLPILLVNRELRHFFLMADDRQVPFFSATVTCPIVSDYSPDAPVHPHRVTQAPSFTGVNLT